MKKYRFSDNGAAEKMAVPLRYQFSIVLFAFSVMLHLSCSSAPNPSSIYKGPPGDFSVLDEGGDTYIFVEVKKSLPILENLDTDLLPGGGREKEIIAMTDRAVAAFYPKDSGRRFMAAASGKFPGSSASMSFAFSPAWKKAKSPTGNSYWRSEGQPLSLFLNRNLALASDGDPFVSPPGFSAPPLLAELSREAALAGMAEGVKISVNRFLDKMGLAINFPGERVLFGVYETADIVAPALAGRREKATGEKYYEGLFHIEAASAREARAFQAALSLARMFILSGGAVADSLSTSGLPVGDISADKDEIIKTILALFANSPVLNDSTLILRTGPLNGRGIALLFNVFFIYSQ